jgi:ribosomal protein S12 methylthiotransferase accessory factor
MYSRLIGPDSGLIKGMGLMFTQYGDQRVWTAVARAHLEQVDCGNTSVSRTTHGTGTSFSVYSAIAAAIGEAIERLCASVYCEAKDILWATYREVAERAVSPSSFALASARELDRFGHFSRFDVDEHIGWVEGKSLFSGRDVLVPASFVFLGYRYRSDAERFSPSASSTGLAAAPSEEAAVLSGLCECVERDAFMITYLNRLPVPALNTEAIAKSETNQLIRDFGTTEGCTVRIWNMTLDLNIPSVLVTLLGHRSDVPAFLCAAATHPSMNIAVHKALLESIQGWSWVRDVVMPNYKGRKFLEDFSDVQSLEDHVACAALQTDLASMNWLLRSAAPQQPAIVHERGQVSSTSTMLASSLESIRQAGLEAIAVDVTIPAAAEAGVQVRKVVVPGLQQIFFGSFRGLGGTRLYEVPKLLGFTDGVTVEDSLNPFPHPFP